MSILSSKKRNSLPDSDFVDQSQRKYPINDKAHARNALARVSSYGDSELKARVRRKVAEKYPSIGKS